MEKLYAGHLSRLVLEVMDFTQVTELDDLLPLSRQQLSKITMNICITHWILERAAFAWQPTIWHRARLIYTPIQVKGHILLPASVDNGWLLRHFAGGAEKDSGSARQSEHTTDHVAFRSQQPKV
ncbi:MAG: hypothetical protein R6W76_00050 [Caldilinea sp.]